VSLRKHHLCHCELLPRSPTMPAPPEAQGATA
jgi:hypothetical protein